MAPTDPPPLFPPGSDPLEVANAIYTDVADNPFDSADRERLRIMVALSMLAFANDTRRIADAAKNPKP
jgi:hypothetical protein